MEHTAYLIQQFRQHASPNADQHASIHGTSHTAYGLSVPTRRRIVTGWIKQHKYISYDEWLEIVDALYHGESYEEKTAPEYLLAQFSAYRHQLPLNKLHDWLGLLEGWAEVDHNCQSTFTAKEILARWDAWQPFLHGLAMDDHISRRRASLVLLCKPIGQSPDERLLEQMFVNIDILRSEKDKLITKAVSWVLRSAIKHHRQAIEQTIIEQGDSLPKIAVRETRKKLDTGSRSPPAITP